MITIFNYADEDGEHVVAHVVDNGELCVEVFPDADPGLGYNVFVPAAEVRRLIDALAQHWPASGGVVEPSPLAAEEATPDCVLTVTPGIAALLARDEEIQAAAENPHNPRAKLRSLHARPRMTDGCGPEHTFTGSCELEDWGARD